MKKLFGELVEGAIEVWESHLPDAPRPYEVYIRTAERKWWATDYQKGGIFRVNVGPTIDAWEEQRNLYLKAQRDEKLLKLQEENEKLMGLLQELDSEAKASTSPIDWSLKARRFVDKIRERFGW